jgi:hypothetical protein
MAKFAGRAMLGLAKDPDAKEAKELAEAMEEFYKSNPGETVGAANVPPSGVQFWYSPAPDKTIAAQLKMFKAFGGGDAFQNVYFKNKPKVEEKTVKYRNYELNSVHFVWDIEKTLANTKPNGQEMPEAMRKQMADVLKRLMGDELNVWFGTDGKNVIQVTAKDFGAAQKMLDQYFKGESPAADDKSFAETRKDAPAETTLLMLIDAVQYSNVIVEVMRPFMEAQAVGMKLPPPIKGKSGFLALSAELSPERGGADLVVSATAVKEIYMGYIFPQLHPKP